MLVVLVLSVAGISERVRPQCEAPVSLEARLGVAEAVRTVGSFRLGTRPAPARDLGRNNRDFIL